MAQNAEVGSIQTKKKLCRKAGDKLPLTQNQHILTDLNMYMQKWQS